MRLLTLILIVAPLSGAAYPIPPQSVRMLTEDAQLVIVARVQERRAIPARLDESFEDTLFADDAVAVLSVEEVWKGVAPKSLEVSFRSAMSCPAPPRYEAGRRVLAFLAKGKNGAWETVGLSYGTKYPQTDAERDALKREVKDVAAAIEAGGFTNREDALIAAFADRATRWRALDVMQREDAEVPSNRRERLMLELERLFIAAPRPDELLPKVLVLFDNVRSKALDAAFARVVDEVLSREPAPYWVLQALPLLEARLSGARPVPSAREPVEEFELALDVKAPSDEAVRKQWTAMKRRFDLKPAR